MTSQRSQFSRLRVLLSVFIRSFECSVMGIGARQSKLLVTQKANKEGINAFRRTHCWFSFIFVFLAAARSWLTHYCLKPFSSSNFEIQPKIGSHHLPTHRRGKHRNFFLDPFFFWKGNFDYALTHKCMNSFFVVFRDII